ncbi:hypothetical protein [Nocardioides xinjiangensis]|uniref:hypothetical protein n=1 Tax=Nocardioides xinjiangensis TaxID=2817376 RepID=UPI001B30C2CE|nr:hypothetical protein [Nocardioides sp. SYSU D00514]
MRKTLRAIGLSLGLVLPVTALPLGFPSYANATAAIEPDIDDVQIARNLYDPRLFVGNYSEMVVRVDFTDPVYGQQSVTLAPGQDNEAAPMCAVPVKQNPTPDAVITFGVDTASPVVRRKGYGEGGIPGRDLEFLRALVVDSRTLMAKARVAVRDARVMLMRAKASGRRVWIRRTTLRLAKARTRFAEAKSRHMFALEDLTRLEEGLAYCNARRVN